MIAVVLTVLVMAAMVPFFAHTLKATSRDEYRVNAANIAQDRIEQVRLLAYTDIIQANLNYEPAPPSPFGDGRFGHTYTLAGDSRPYRIDYLVQPANDPTAAQKYIKVSVSRTGSAAGKVITADTIIENPEAGGSTSTVAPSPSALPNCSISVKFTNWTEVDGNGVWVERVQTNVTPAATVTPTPLHQYPSAGQQELKWTNLRGGAEYTYTVFCDSSRATYTLKNIPFRLWDNRKVYFDTYPGGD